MEHSVEGERAHIQVDGDVHVQGVPFLELPRVWDAMADALIHRCAHALGEVTCMPQGLWVMTKPALQMSTIAAVCSGYLLLPAGTSMCVEGSACAHHMSAGRGRRCSQ